MKEQRIGEAVISDFSCDKCFDTYIQTGHAMLDGERVCIQRICECQKKNKKKDNEVVYDWE